MNLHTEPEYISINELRTRLAALRGGRRPSYNSIYRAIRVSDMPYHTDPFSGRFMFRWMEVVDWLSDHKIPAPEPDRGSPGAKAKAPTAVAAGIVRGVK